MSSLYLTSLQLNTLGRYKLAKNFILMPRGKTHIRIDLTSFPGGKLTMPVPSVSANSEIACLATSFHVKIDARHDVTIEEQVKTIEDWSDYLYFKYVDGGVWQPIWGYSKFARTIGGAPGGTYKDTLPTDSWGEMMESGRKFINKLSNATKVTQHLACGPIQGQDAHLFTQL